MRIYDRKNTAELMAIVCNKCGRRIPVIKGVPQEDALHVEKSWGYFSRKDGERHSFDICEECYDKWMAGFEEPALTEENVELI